jgi:hypothetical protein
MYIVNQHTSYINTLSSVVCSIHPGGELDGVYYSGSRVCIIACIIVYIIVYYSVCYSVYYSVLYILELSSTVEETTAAANWPDAPVHARSRDYACRVSRVRVRVHRRLRVCVCVRACVRV